MRILVWNHSGLVSGGARSMLEPVSGLRERGVDARFGAGDTWYSCFR